MANRSAAVKKAAQTRKHRQPKVTWFARSPWSTLDLSASAAERWRTNDHNWFRSRQSSSLSPSLRVLNQYGLRKH